MARSAQSKMRDEVEMVVDADAHITEKIEEYVPYMDEGVRTLFERTDAYFRNVMSLTNAVPPAAR